MDAVIKVKAAGMGIRVEKPQVFLLNVSFLPEELFTQIASALVTAPYLRNNNHSLSAVAPDYSTMKGESAWANAA